MLAPGSLGLTGGSTGKESAWKVGELGLIPRLGRFPGEGNGHPLQYFGLKNSMDCKKKVECRRIDASEL